MRRSLSGLCRFCGRLFLAAGLCLLVASLVDGPHSPLSANQKKSAAKSKKKERYGIQEFIRPMEKVGFGFPGSNFTPGMSPYMAYQNNMQSMGNFAPQPTYSAMPSIGSLGIATSNGMVSQGFRPSRMGAFVVRQLS